jgi:ADP-heptose:LPS heptosyltransferase
VDAAFLPAISAITDLSTHLTDFAETAAIVTNLDLVITVDTSIAHLAGALGKPVWILLPHYPDFRWLVGRDDSPWYPTATLFRQASSGDWRNVIETVKAALDAQFKST